MCIKFEHHHHHFPSRGGGAGGLALPPVARNNKAAKITAAWPARLVKEEDSELIDGDTEFRLYTPHRGKLMAAQSSDSTSHK